VFAVPIQLANMAGSLSDPGKTSDWESKEKEAETQ